MVSLTSSAILSNYRRVLDDIERAAVSAGRDPGAVRLVVVTKSHPVEAVQEALEGGLRLFGENYVEEGLEKIQAVRLPAGDAARIEWHMIGHLQSRKARPVVEHFHALHSLDSLKLAARLDRFASEMGRRLPVLLECNVSGEQTKFGWPAWDEARWGDLLSELGQLAALSNLEWRGLMTMAPFFDSPEAARPYFQRLRSLRDFLVERIPGVQLPDLSMGMSGDFTVAVQEGATLVRVGTAIMGTRKPLD
jgi:pyridoxal phosphate enzyme (YggS family)